MNPYSISALVAFVIFGMGMMALIFGAINYMQTNNSKAGALMFGLCISVFGWDFGYAWMGICHGDSFAYVPRALALFFIIFYMAFTLGYVAYITAYPKKKLAIPMALCLILYLGAWTQIIQPDAVTFEESYWGYWYYSKLTLARLIQFVCIIGAVIQYYIILSYGKKHAQNKREKYVFKRFDWFGPIFAVGYLFDTFLPSIMDIPAVPGSCISAFASTMILFRISQQNKVFGLSKANVSKYVFEDVKLPVIITDKNGHIVLFNDFTPIYLERKDYELYGYPLDDLFKPLDAETVVAIHSGHECKVDLTQVRDDFDELQYTIYIFRDISKQRQAFMDLEASRAQAEEANRAKSNFLANMSHEIRTPMNAIIGMSEIILQDDTTPVKTVAQVNEIYTAGKNLLGIVNDILDLSKIEAGRYELIIDKYELPSLIHDITSMIDIRIQETNIVLDVKLDATLPKYLVGDVGRIRQILLNILGNAVKFMKKGTITLEVNWNKDKKAPCLCFDVTDTGIGIKPEDMDRIFGEFNQVDTRKNRNVQGTGLGLAISKQLAQLMDGDITVESEYGKGSCFHVVIRQKIEAYAAIGPDIKNALENKTYELELKKQTMSIVPRPDAKVLIVDDTKVNLMVARGIMRKYEMRIDTATSGAEAIEMVKKTEYDLIFMDHMMPEMDGIEATKEIRKLGGRNETLPIIALTANAINEAKALFIQEGLQDFVAKPIDVKALDIVLNHWLPVE